MITILVRKDALAAKWAGGLDAFKAEIAFNPDWHQEDDHLITAGYSMGTDVQQALDFLKEGGLAVVHKVVVQREVAVAESGLSRLYRELRRRAKPTRIETVEVEAFADVAIVQFAGATRYCPWLVRTTAASGRPAIEFGQNHHIPDHLFLGGQPELTVLRP